MHTQTHAAPRMHIHTRTTHTQTHTHTDTHTHTHTYTTRTLENTLLFGTAHLGQSKCLPPCQSGQLAFLYCDDKAHNNKHKYNESESERERETETETERERPRDRERDPATSERACRSLYLTWGVGRTRWMEGWRTRRHRIVIGLSALLLQQLGCSVLLPANGFGFSQSVVDDVLVI